MIPRLSPMVTACVRSFDLENHFPAAQTPRFGVCR